MRWILLPLTAVLISGCDSLVNFDSDCSAERTSIRLREGRSPDADTDVSEVAGNFTQRWTYEDGGDTRIYTFHWGVSYEGCQVDGPISRALIPLTL